MSIKRGCDCLGVEVADPPRVAAVWVAWSGVKYGLCQRHLDLWLDAADVVPEWEPLALDLSVWVGQT